MLAKYNVQATCDQWAVIWYLWFKPCVKRDHKSIIYYYLKKKSSLTFSQLPVQYGSCWLMPLFNLKFIRIKISILQSYSSHFRCSVAMCSQWLLELSVQIEDISTVQAVPPVALSLTKCDASQLTKIQLDMRWKMTAYFNLSILSYQAFWNLTYSVCIFFTSLCISCPEPYSN